MLTQLALVLIAEAGGPMAAGEAVGPVRKNIEDTELPRIIMYRQ